jgi:hypothetical protein
VETLAAINTLPGGTGVFSSTCLVHCLSSASDFYTFTVNGETLSQALNQWYFQEQTVHIVSSCTGWGCTEDCSGGPWQPSNTPCPTTTNQCVNDYANIPSAQAPQTAQAVFQEQQVAAQIASEEAVASVKQSYSQEAGSVQSMTQEQQNAALAKEEAAEKAAGAAAAGNAVWSVQMANAKAKGGDAVWALEHAPPAQARGLTTKLPVTSAHC